MPRPAPSSEGLQSKWASLWFMQRAQGALAGGEPPRAGVTEPTAETTDNVAEHFEPVPVVTTPDVNDIVWPMRGSNYSGNGTDTDLVPHDAASELAFPFDGEPSPSESLQKFASRHWKEAMLTVVVVVLACGLVSAWPRSSSEATWFQALMVRTGVMKPQSKVFAGRADARVWIDVHTQVYYCSGEDLYGKTPDGEFTTQYNAQSDGYASASNTTCP
jgi:hypothetical protein